MTTGYWQAKIWGLLHDPALKALHNNTGRGKNSFWQQLEVMSPWVENNPEESGKNLLKYIKLADYISSASDRGAIGTLVQAINYNDQGLEVAHLLSGAKQHLKLKDKTHQELINNRLEFLQGKEQELLQKIPEDIREDPRKLFWWLWRCLPEKTCELFDDETALLLMPGETRLPDSSIWSHTSLTAALAGALAGYDLTTEALEKPTSQENLSHPYLASFTFSPIQELIKASRKMKDFWAGSWILHYLSAKVCWSLAWKYGPDCFIYPNLYGQPLIDYWINQKFGDWVKKPSDRSLLTAGFPNVLVLILPFAKVEGAMQYAKSLLIEEWHNIAELALQELQDKRHWLRELKPESKTWKGWLDAQWQTYWTAVPIGSKEVRLKSKSLSCSPDQVKEWIKQQNTSYGIEGTKLALFQEKEREFLQKAAEKRFEQQKRHFSINVGSWWAPIFDQTRIALATVKNARNWEIPTVFGPRSTISGIGCVVHPQNKDTDWISEGETKKYWQRHAGVFDGIEQLNATETVKRVLEKILPKLLDSVNLIPSYPDLTSGVAGYLRVNGKEAQEHFEKACQGIFEQFRHQIDISNEKWGIPYLDAQKPRYHPRLLNAGWLMEDIKEEVTDKNQLRNQLQNSINTYYPQNNPTDWYVLAAGDGDGMSEWLKGKKMKPYEDYIASDLNLDKTIPEFREFLQVNKRMGPSTHNALSRALLDFSNQLLPYLTENRYSGRLIYGGGDDVLAYTNLWEWDRWLWDIRQCFRGDKDREFNNQGDYWCWQDTANLPENLSNRPLFTMGREATISFGIIIAHHSVPLAIALENLWLAEEEAKEHLTPSKQKKDAVQVRVIYGNGNILQATSKFAVFQQWQELITIPEIESSLFEQAANLWLDHPIPCASAINPWVNAFCERREKLTSNRQEEFSSKLNNFLQQLWETTPPTDLNLGVKNWLKLAAFTIRNRQIKLGV